MLRCDPHDGRLLLLVLHAQRHGLVVVLAFFDASPLQRLIDVAVVDVDGDVVGDARVEILLFGDAVFVLHDFGEEDVDGGGLGVGLLLGGHFFSLNESIQMNE